MFFCLISQSKFGIADVGYASKSTGLALEHAYWYSKTLVVHVSFTDSPTKTRGGREDLKVKKTSFSCAMMTLG